MSTAPGWYPDPAGQPDHLRYFDGQHWAEAAVPRSQVPGGAPPLNPPPPHQPNPPHPGQRPPHPGQHPPHPGQHPRGSAPKPRGKSPGVVLVILGAVLLLAVIGAVVWQNTRPDPTPPPVGSSPTETFDADAHPCPAMPAHRNDHPNDGMVHGGGLAFAPPAGFESFTKSALPDFATDAAGVQYRVPPDWAAVLSVGAIPISEYPAATRQVTLQVLHCIAGSDFYPNGTRVEVIDDGDFSTDGHRVSRVEARLTSPDPKVPVDLVTVAVVMTGDLESLGVYFGSAPEDQRSLTTTVDGVLRNLVVE